MEHMQKKQHVGDGVGGGNWGRRRWRGRREVTYWWEWYLEMERSGKVLFWGWCKQFLCMAEV